MKRVKFIAPSLVALCLIVTIFGCAPASQPAEKPTAEQPKETATAVIQLKASHGYPAGQYQMHVIHQYFKEAVEKYTNGRVQVTIYPSAQLFSAKDEAAACALGNIDFISTPNVYLSTMFPALKFMEFPFLFQDNAHLFRFYDASKDVLASIYAQKGIKYLGETGYPWYGVWNTKRPLTTMGDFKGLKLRAAGVQKLAVESWGASGVMIDPNELPTALQQGMVDGGIHTPSLVADTPLYPYLKYGSSPYKYLFHGFIPQLMSLKTWNSLPADVQTVIEKTVAPEVYQRSIKLDEELTGGRYKTIEDSGVKLAWFSDAEIEKMKAAFKPIQDQELPKYGPEAAALVDIVIKTRR